MTSMARAPPSTRSRPPPNPPWRKSLLFGSLFPLEPLEPPDPPDPPDLSPVPTLRRFLSASPRLSLSSAFHLIVALCQCLNRLVHESLMLLGFLTSFAVASCKRGFRCRFQVLWLMVLTCSPPPSLMTALTSDLPHETSALPPLLHSSRNLQWPEVKKLRRALPSLSSRTMNLLPTGKIYFDWTWCEQEPHTEVLPLPLDRSVKIYSSEHQGAFSPVRNPLLDIRTSLFSPQKTFRYTPLDPTCVWFFKSPSMSKNVNLSCYLPWQLNRRYGNAEHQSCKEMSTQDGVSENNEAFQLLSYMGSFGVSMGFWPGFKMLIKQPMFSDTSSSTTVLHSSELRKLVSVSSLNLTTMVKVIQISSRQSRERSFFPKKRIMRPSFLTRDATEPVPSVIIIASPTAIKISSSRSPMVYIPESRKIYPNSPVTSATLGMVIQTSSRQGRERSVSTSSFLKERIYPQTSLFARGSSSPHSATVSFETALLTAETLALQNAMTSTRQYGINTLLIYSDFQIFFNLVKSRRRPLEIDVLLIDTLSNLSKLVSLSLIFFVFYFPKTAHHYVDVVSILVYV